MNAREYLAILHIAERLKDTPRHCTTSKRRIESVAEHSWRVSLMAYLLKYEFKDVDMNKVISMCLIHDLGECFTGDIPVFLKTEEDRDDEHSLLDSWVNTLPEELSADMKALYKEMNEQETKESKIYKALDKLEAVIQHNESPIDTWLENEYELNKKYAYDTVAFSDWLTDLRREILEETLEKIEKEGKTLLRTERLLLRRWNEGDAGDLYMYASDPDVGPIAGWPTHKSLEESRDVIKNVLNGKEAYAICLKKDGRAIGAIELKLKGHTDMTDRDDECEMGYWVGKPFWGQGIVPEAVREMLRHAFEDCGMQKVWIGYYDGNTKSKRVQEKCGFKYQWTSKDVDVPLMHEKRTGHVSLMTREDWLALCK